MNTFTPVLLDILKAKEISSALSREVDVRCRTNIWECSSLPDIDVLIPGRCSLDIGAPTRGALAQAELIDDQWKRLETFLPRPSAKGGRAGLNDRRFVEAVIWLWRKQTTWSHLPAVFGPWAVHYDRFHRWQQQGRWEGFACELAHLDEFRWLRTIDLIGQKCQVGFPRATTRS